MSAPVVIPFEKRTVFDAQGRGDLGTVSDEIAAAINCNAGMIRLLNGVQGRHSGFGLAHIEHHASRIKQVQGLGFRGALDYVRFIASGYDRIASQENGRLMFLREKTGMHHRLVCQWDQELGIWSATTAIPKTGISDLTIVWEKVTV
jgi:hypothetical protein